MSKDTSKNNAPNPPVSGTPPMTLRQWYAGLAMQGMLACPVQPQSGPDMFARDAFAMADAMLAEGSK